MKKCENCDHYAVCKTHYVSKDYVCELWRGWHDLRKNPQDLPDDFHNVLICIKGFEGTLTEVNIAVHNGFTNLWGTESLSYKDDEVIAWREIEPFESAELKWTELCELIEKEPETEVVANSDGTVKPIYTRYIVKSSGRMMHVAWCGVCGKYKQRVALGDRYCRNCGTKIDWSEGYKA